MSYLRFMDTLLGFTISDYVVYNLYNPMITCVSWGVIYYFVILLASNGFRSLNMINAF
jgi:hypothetical protein